MYSHVFADARRFLDSGGQLSFAVLVWRRENAVAHRIAAGLIDLDEIGAFLELPADYLNQLLCVVRISRVREHMLLGVEAVGVLMPAEEVDSVAADAHARARDLALIDCISYRGIGGARALGTHVALSRETGHQ